VSEPCGIAEQLEACRTGVEGRHMPGGEEDDQKGTGVPDLEVRYAHRAHLHGDGHIVIMQELLQKSEVRLGNLER